MFVQRLYKEWRPLFWVLLLFVLGQAFFMAKGIQNLPFFLYHMYSQTHPPKDSTAVYLVRTADGYFDHKQLSNRELEILMNSISYYVNLTKAGDGTKETMRKRFEKMVSPSTLAYLEDHLSNDSTAIAMFPQWWGRYFRSLSNNRYDAADVVKSYVYSVPPYKKSSTDSLVFRIKLK